VSELNLLKDFQDRFGAYADGFELIRYGDTGEVETWSKDPEFLDRDEHSPDHEAFVEWLDRNFGLAPAGDPNEVIAAARDEYGERFETWLARFVADS
jgi:hypothetical protein